MSKFISGITIFLLLVQLMGCSTFGSRTQIMSIDSKPAGAKVTINGKDVGTTPLQHEHARKDQATIEINKTGYKSYSVTTTKSISTLGAYDLIGAILILLPAIGFLSSAAFEQSPMNIDATLEPR